MISTKLMQVLLGDGCESSGKQKKKKKKKLKDFFSLQRL